MHLFFLSNIIHHAIEIGAGETQSIHNIKLFSFTVKGVNLT